MTILLFTAIALAILALLLFAARVTRSQREGAPNEHAWKNVDVAAFRTLMRVEDEEYLRAHLTPSDLRRVRRARILAVQQYLRWIASDCGALLEVLQLNQPDQENSEWQRLMKQALRLRFTAFAIWSFLWLQYALPGLDVMPRTVANKYELLREQVNMQCDSASMVEALMPR